MAVIQSLGRLADVELGWTPMYTYTSMTLYDGKSYDYAALYRTQPNVRTCVDFLARNVAQLGLQVFRRVSETDRVRLRDHPLALLIEQPLPPAFKVTRYRLIESLMADLGVWFNAYWLKIKRESGNQGMGLLRIPPDLVTVTGGLVPTGYEINLGGVVQTVVPEEVVHFRGYNAENCIAGLSPLETLRRVLAEEEAMGDYREHFWENAARMGGVIERPAEAPEWGEAARARFKQEFEQLYSGGDNSGKTAILEEGMEWKESTFNAQESEYLGGRKLTREECARAYHIPLPMVGILEHATFSNIREQHKNLYQDSLGPWLAMVEQDIMLQLLPDLPPTDGVYCEFNIAEKLAGSFEEQAATLQAAVGRPWMTPDEARAKLNLPSMGGDAALLGVPLNVMVGQGAGNQVSGNQESGSEEGEKAAARLPQSKAEELDPTRMASREQWERKWAQVLGEFFRRQERTFMSRLPKSRGAKGVDDVWTDPERWNAELAEDWYKLAMMTAAEFAKWVAKELSGSVEAELMADYWRESAGYAAANINRASREQLAGVLRSAQDDPGVDVRKAMRDLFAIWATSRALEIGRTGVTHAANFGSHEGARASGLRSKTWQVNSTNPRDAHLAMHGETVPVGALFSNGMRWPGDPAGGAENNAGCQCSVRFGR